MQCINKLYLSKLSHVVKGGRSYAINNNPVYSRITSSQGDIGMQHVLFYWHLYHYGDVILSAMASQITGISIVHSTVCSGADQRKHQSSASLAFVRGIHWWPVNSPHKGLVTRNMFYLMTLSWYRLSSREAVEPTGFLIRAGCHNHNNKTHLC